MKSDGLRAQQRLRTRAAILDATESIMREEGYAAVSSRRIADKGGLKSQLVHYHFGNMDEVFLALFRRSEDAFFSIMSEVIASPDPLKKLWDLNMSEESTLVLEFTAIAIHRSAFRDELIRTADRARSLEQSVTSRALNKRKFYNIRATPNVFSFILQSVTRALVMEKGVGITKGHSEVSEFFEQLLTNLTPESETD